MANNFTANQRAAVAAGAAIQQRFRVAVPMNAAHSAYGWVELDKGIFRAGSNHGFKRVKRAGTRTHKVWNPHPTNKTKPKAVRWTFTCANTDGYFHPGVGNLFDPAGIYQATPQECFVQHELWVEESPDVFTEVPHMRFYGRILKLQFVPTADRVEDTVKPGDVAVVVEQAGAWDVLRQEFTAEDGDYAAVDDPGGLGHAGFNYT